MAFSDWYELLDKQTVAGDAALNVYHVAKSNPAFTAQDVFNAFQDSVLPSIIPAQHTGIDHVSVDVRSLDDPLDFFAGAPAGSSGTRAGVRLTQFSAAAIQFSRLRTDMKNGQKRFSAGIETDASGDTWEPAFLPVLTTLANAIILPWEQLAAPGVEVCRFGILKRVCTVDPPPEPCPSYRLPEDDAELVFYVPVQFVVRPTIRSQVSRKVL